MNWDALFGLTNVIALAGWFALAALPRGPKVMALILYVGVALLCMIYAALFVLVIGQAVDPGLVAGASGGGGFTSSGAIRALFLSDAGVVVGWTHYLAFDLFVGLWIAKDADHKGFSRLVQLPFLFATLVAGPIGLLLWLIVRERRARRAARQA
jgi:hypothetical protein